MNPDPKHSFNSFTRRSDNRCFSIIHAFLIWPKPRTCIRFEYKGQWTFSRHLLLGPLPVYADACWDGYVIFLGRRQMICQLVCLIPVLSLDPNTLLMGLFISKWCSQWCTISFNIKRIKTVNRLLYYSRRLCHEMVRAFLTGVDKFRPELIFLNFKDAPIKTLIFTVIANWLSLGMLSSACNLLIFPCILLVSWAREISPETCPCFPLAEVQIECHLQGKLTNTTPFTPDKNKQIALESQLSPKL